LKLIILAAAIGAAALATAACGSAASVPPGQPGASPPPSAACLTAGNCTAAQQQQVAASNGITNPDGLNGCLVAGNCTASQQQGIAAGMSAVGSSSAAPAPSSPPPGQVTANFICSVDRPGIGGLYTLTTTNPGTTAIYVGTVQLNFYDDAGNLIDTETTDVDLQVPPGQSVVTHDAEEASAAPVTCSETSWSDQP
jgi:hypothetical protein